jgi:hypothetical protein
MSLMDRIMGVFTFKREVYADVKKDTSFTPTAWGIVIGTQLINGIISFLTAGAAAAAIVGASGADLGGLGIAAGGSLVSTLVGLVIGIAGFALFCWIAMFVANSVFKATTKFDEMVRTLGLAYVWNLVGVLNVLLLISVFFGCLTGILGLAAVILWAVSGAFAIKETTSLDWTQTIVTIVIAVIAYWIVSAVVGGVVFASMFAMNL